MKDLYVYDHKKTKDTFYITWLYGSKDYDLAECIIILDGYTFDDVYYANLYSDELEINIDFTGSSYKEVKAKALELLENIIKNPGGVVDNKQ